MNCLSNAPAGFGLRAWAFLRISDFGLRVFLVLLASESFGDIKTLIEHNDNDHATAEFKLKDIPSPSEVRAAHATFTIADGQRDESGGGLDKLHDGRLPGEADQPAENFFFEAGSEGGELLLDLGGDAEVQHILTYSWHPSTRGPQVYGLYAKPSSSPAAPKAAGEGGSSVTAPKKGTDPTKSGWALIAKVDTRPKEGEAGGQYAVSITDSAGDIGKYRYLLFDILRTESDDPFGNTFYSEIAVVAKAAATGAEARSDPSDQSNQSDRSEEKPAPYTIESPDHYCRITIDTSDAPELKAWAETNLAPALAKWYPDIVAMLPSTNYSAPKSFSVTLRPGNGVAATGGTRVTANSNWIERELGREAVGALIHEEVHVVQQYRGGRRSNPDYQRPPGWLVEGIPDYIRWFIYEPQSHGADIEWLRRQRRLNLHYDARYRVSANFLDYVIVHYDQKRELLTKINAACRQGTYTDDLWETLTGKTLQALDEEWRGATQKQLEGPASDETPNTKRQTPEKLQPPGSKSSGD